MYAVRSVPGHRGVRIACDKVAIGNLSETLLLAPLLATSSAATIVRFEPLSILYPGVPSLRLS